MDRRVAFVTGASRGIGRAIAEKLASDGCHVVLVARSADRLEALAKEITDQGGSAEACPCDIGDGEALAKAVTDAAERHGRFDILVNNAGITRDDLLLRMSDEAWDEVIHVNLRSAFVACRPRYAHDEGPIWADHQCWVCEWRHGQPWSGQLRRGQGRDDWVHQDHRQRVCWQGCHRQRGGPGFIATDMTDALPDQVKEEATKRIPAKRLGPPKRSRTRFRSSPAMAPRTSMAEFWPSMAA